jgi:hypothetical protein
LPHRFTTSTFSTVVPSIARSTFSLSGTIAPRRHPPSAVITSFARASSMRSASASLENPPNTTVCGAPSRAHASIAIAASGIIGM